jgi:hypothetical protein
MEYDIVVLIPPGLLPEAAKSFEDKVIDELSPLAADIGGTVKVMTEEEFERTKNPEFGREAPVYREEDTHGKLVIPPDFMIPEGLAESTAAPDDQRPRHVYD